MQFNRYPYTLFLLLACWAIATLASCVDDRERLSTPEVAVDFLPSLPGPGPEAGQPGSRAGELEDPHGDLAAPSRGSRAVNSTWAEDDAVGIYMVAHNTTPVDLTALSAGNHKYLTTVAGTTTSLTPDGAAIYYPVDNSEVNFIGYYPYKSTVTTTYPVDVATQNPQTNIDLLYHKGTIAYYRLSGSVPMLFKHQLSKMIITVLPDDGVTTDLSETTATLAGFPTTATFNLATGVLGAAGTIASELTPVKNTDATTAEKAVFEAILVPHNDAADETEYTREISLTIDGKSYTYPLEAEHTFVSGIAYSYNFRFTDSELKLESSTILNWNEGEDIGGDYVLSLSKNEIEVSGTEASTGHTLTVLTTSPTKPTLKLSDRSDAISAVQPDYWISNATLVGGSSTALTGWTSYTLTFDTAAQDEGASENRMGYIFVCIDGLSAPVAVNQIAGVPPVTEQPITVSADGMTNCYIVNTNSSVSFKVSRAYTYNAPNFTTTLHIGGTYTGEFVCKTIWDDNSVLNGTSSGSDILHTVDGSGNQAVVTINTGGNQGNAVVGLYRKGTTIPVWSYHIWVLTDYNPATTTFLNNGFTFMDRNLGATEAANSLAGRGLMYQWGRKDPFPGEAKAGVAGYGALGNFTGLNGAPPAIGASTAAEGVVASIKNPTTFYRYYTSSHFDWLPVLDNTLWNTSTNQKTIYDPCPPGWRVPRSDNDTASPWYGLVGQTFTEGDTGGCSWSMSGSTTYYPAAGYRNPSTGTCDKGGMSGYYVGASVDGNNAARLLFKSDGSLSWGYGMRSSACSVRCVHEYLYVGEPDPATFTVAPGGVTGKTFTIETSSTSPITVGSNLTTNNDSMITDLSATCTGPTNGMYTWTVTFNVAEYTDTENSREGTITVVIDGVTKTINVSQAAVYVTAPNPASFSNLSAEAATGRTITFETNCRAASLTSLTTTNTAMITGLKSTRVLKDAANDVYKWTITFNMTENSNSKAGRSGNISFAIGGITKTVSVSQVACPITEQVSTGVADGMSNCYIVNTNSNVGFRVSRAYTYNGSAFTNTLHVGGTYTGSFQCKTLWDDNTVISSTTVSGSGNTAVITVNTSGAQGNAVVGLYKADGTTLLWSYHIWVLTSYNPASKTFSNNGFTFMDRNLGATEAANSLAGRGLMYQHGRKDPFPGVKSGVAGYNAMSKFTGLNNTATAVSATTNDEGIVKSIQNPTTFFGPYTGNIGYDWLPDTNTTSTLWTTSSSKNIYDPCPSGWRVPVFFNADIPDPWSGVSLVSKMSGDSGGATWSMSGGNIYFPCSGYITYFGVLNDDGGVLLWSAEHYGRKASHMSYYSALGGGGRARADGLPVRCVRE